MDATGLILRRCAGPPGPPIGAHRPRQVLPGLLATMTAPLLPKGHCERPQQGLRLEAEQALRVAVVDGFTLGVGAVEALDHADVATVAEGVVRSQEHPIGAHDAVAMR